MAIEKLFKQVGEEVIEFTLDEYAQRVADKAADILTLAEEAKRAAAKAALLKRIGITADEAELLLS
ncbi:MAG: hypothetical protein QX196_03140 [Methylococcaceae bacterium]